MCPVQSVPDVPVHSQLSGSFSLPESIAAMPDAIKPIQCSNLRQPSQSSPIENRYSLDKIFC